MDPKVLILMGSDSDWEVMSEAKKALDEMGVAAEVHVSSAHRTPERTGRLAREAAGRGIQVIVCGAGAAAHLAGVCAAETELPVLGVPLAASDLKGLDALLSTAQMPAGVPVGTLAIGTPGASSRARTPRWPRRCASSARGWRRRSRRRTRRCSRRSPPPNARSSLGP